MRRTQEKFLRQCKKAGACAKFCTFGTRESALNGLDQKLYEKMTASIKGREDKLCDREDCGHRRPRNYLKTKKNSWNQLRKHWKRKRTKLEPRERQVEKGRAFVSYLTGDV